MFIHNLEKIYHAAAAESSALVTSHIYSEIGPGLLTSDPWSLPAHLAQVAINLITSQSTDAREALSELRVRPTLHEEVSRREAGLGTRPRFPLAESTGE